MKQQILGSDYFLTLCKNCNIITFLIIRLLYQYKTISGSPHYAQLGNTLQKHFFANSAWITDTLKGSINRFSNFSAQSQNFTGV